MFNIQTIRRNSISRRIASGLDAYWRLDGNSKDVIRGLDGTDTNISYSFTDGKVAQGALFDGSSSDISINSGSSLVYERTQKFSIAAWVKSTASSSEKPIYSTEENSPNYLGITLWYSSFFSTNKLSLFMGSNTQGIGVGGSTTLSDGNWHFVVATYDGSSDASGVKLYCDGNLESMTVNQNNLASQTLVGSALPHIGTRQGGLFWVKSIDEVGVWKRILTPEEIKYLYNNGNGKSYPFN